MKTKVVLAAVFIALAAFIAVSLYLIAAPTPLVFQGQVEAREVDVAAKVPGRVSALLVRVGDSVQVGDSLFEMDSPEIDAKMQQASSGRDAAIAVSNKADTGARVEEIEMARFAWDGAKSAAELAEKTRSRLESLYNEGLVSEQKYDEAVTMARASQDAANAAKAQYDMALNGAREEDKAAAAAVVGQAEGVVAEVSAFAEETRLSAPISGEVTEILVDVGELAPTGFPVVTLVDLNDSWVILKVREDHLMHFKKDAQLAATVPALDNENIVLSVFHIAAQADFATWRATRYSSGYDVKTFEVHLRPSKAIEGLRPGMSVLIDVD
ncbi:HlyD family secretion protein [Glaciecola siphonariae]|uniref:HlyD family secretion protein n=1 Tax=Glaciecola siphonariae TaxID=521012 RepID=A0ABV9LRS1_9ALTE